jgi:SNF2 family DNA or RNA helicase
MGGSVGAMDEDGQPIKEQHVFNPNPKLDAAAEYLDLAFENPTDKAVVFAQFRSEIATLEELAEKRGWNPVVFHGDVPEEKRDAGRQRFQKDPAARIFIAQYQTGSYGLNLVAANHILFYGLTFDLELFSQARKRVHRKGQERMVNEVIFQAVTGAGGKTMDHLILAALDEKQDFADMVTGDYRALRTELAAL